VPWLRSPLGCNGTSSSLRSTCTGVFSSGIFDEL
jgi:hypothetical protein